MSNDMNVREKQQVSVGAAENTSDKPIFSPTVDIWENDQGLTLVADMPGVAPEDLSLDLSENTLTISGRVAPPIEGRKPLFKEYDEGNFYRQFSLAETIDQSNITASLRDGVLKLQLPRVAPAQPRKIEIKTEEDSHIQVTGEN